MIIEICGPPGAGKSIISKHLQQLLCKQNFNCRINKKPFLIRQINFSNWRVIIKSLAKILYKVIPALITNPYFTLSFLKNLPIEKSYSCNYWFTELIYGSQSLVNMPKSRSTDEIIICDGGISNAIASIEVISPGAGVFLANKIILSEDHYFVYLNASSKELEERVMARKYSQPHEASFYCYRNLLDEIVSGYERCFQAVSCVIEKDNLMLLVYDNGCDPSLVSLNIMNYISSGYSTVSEMKK